MDSDIKKYDNKQAILTIMTTCIMIAIISIVTIARGSMKAKELESVPTMSSYIELTQDNGLNISEKRVLMMLSDWKELHNKSMDLENNTNEVYFNYLKEYLRKSEVVLSTDKAHEIEDLIKGRNTIIHREKESDIKKMSIDGRKVTIYIFKQIYKLCGLKLAFSSERDIEQIVDMSGNVIYLKTGPLLQSEIQFDVLVITLTLILTLFGICIFIAKKNQLFIRSGRYYGFNEKEFTQQISSVG
ncbi:MAG TPA: hypothetical protein VJZ06_00260 [Mobilitalea sp.]|nr:hypothetical protein [Mobilitalea sp.]